MSGFLLDEMQQESLERVRALRAQTSLSELLGAAGDTAPAPPLRTGEFAVIAEVKLRAPSAGALVSAGLDGEALAVAQASRYARAGAAAVSVLTQPTRFSGELRHLSAVAAALQPVGVPAMRKDFLVAPIQIAEARVAGAGGVLLIVRMLSRSVLQEMRDLAFELGMFVLLEAFNADELDVIRSLPPPAGDATQLVGVNTRDLKTLEVDSSRLARLAPALPSNSLAVAESGIHQPSDAARVVGLGYRAVLVGTALMRSEDPESLVAGLLGAGQGAACG